MRVHSVWPFAEIRRFPSFYFYEDRLKDAPSTLAYDMQYYGDRRFRPYLFFDVAGQETQRRSVRNASEASFIAQHLGMSVATSTQSMT